MAVAVDPEEREERSEEGVGAVQNCGGKAGGAWGPGIQDQRKTE